MEAKLNSSSPGRKRHIFLQLSHLSACLLIPKCFLTSHRPFINFHQPLSLVPAVPLGGLEGKLVESGFTGGKCIALARFLSMLQKKNPKKKQKPHCSVQ